MIRRLHRLALAFGCAVIAATASGQETWETPVVVKGVVVAGAESRTEPVVGAHVALRGMCGDLLLQERRREAFDSTFGEATTDENGAFEITLPAWTTRIYRRLAIVATSDGRVGAADVCPFDRTTHRLRIRLASQRGDKGFRFILRDASDRPLSGRRVALVRIAFRPNLVFDSFVTSFRETDAEGACFVEDEGEGVAIVDAPDRMRLVSYANARGRTPTLLGASDLVEPRFEERMRSFAKWSEQARPPSRLEVDRAFDARVETASLGGRVVDTDGRPIAGVEVSLPPPDAPFGGFESHVVGRWRPVCPFAVTDANGRFTVRRLREGAYATRFAVRGFSARDFGVRFVREGAHVDLGDVALDEGGKIQVLSDCGSFTFFGGSVSLPFGGVISCVAPGVRTLYERTGDGCCVTLRPGRSLVVAGKTVVEDFEGDSGPESIDFPFDRDP